MKTEAIQRLINEAEEARAAALELNALEEAHDHMVRALHHVMKASVNERVWNEGAGRVDDMKAICRAALKKAGAL